jgi:hypothetical protein
MNKQELIKAQGLLSEAIIRKQNQAQAFANDAVTARLQAEQLKLHRQRIAEKLRILN